MEKQHIITLTGKPGSGKSSTADRVAEMLGYSRYSSGQLVRDILEAEELTLTQYNKKAGDDHALDARVDEKLRDLRQYDDIVIDARLGFYWLPESFKVYLDLDIDVATARIFKDSISNQSRQQAGELTDSLASARDAVHARMEAEQDRFRRLYNIDPFNTEHFDLVIDTSRHSPETVALTVYDMYHKWLKSDTWSQVHSAIPMGYSFQNKY
jgi:cytidylate kinase